MICKKGEIVLIKFPFTTLLQSKKRPVLVIRDENEYGDFVCFQIAFNSGSGTCSTSFIGNMRRVLLFFVYSKGITCRYICFKNKSKMSTMSWSKRGCSKIYTR